MKLLSAAFCRSSSVLVRTGCLLLGFPVLAQAASFECMLEPNQIVEVRSAVEGLIRKIHVQRGDNVNAGQVLVELESSVERSAAAAAKYRSEAEGRLAASRNRMEFAMRKTERSNELHKLKFISSQARDEAETERNLAASELKEAQESQEMARLDYQRVIDLLNQKTLRSPFSGIVADRMLNPGDLAEAGTGRKPILKLAQVNPLRVEVVLPPATFGKISTGMKAQVMPENGGQYTAVVKVVDRVFDSASGTYGIRLELPNPKGALPGGMRCQVDFPQLGAADLLPTKQVR
jgi:RND family efflux transporter MFP subunit